MGDTHVYVEADVLDTDRVYRMADEVESAFDEPVDEAAVPSLTWPRWVVLAAIVAVAALTLSRAI